MSKAFIEDEEFEGLARAWREALGVDQELNPNMATVLRELKFRGYIADYVRVPNEMMTDAEARFDPEGPTIFVRESTFVGAKNGNPRPNWAIAHELGHFVCGHQHVRNRSANAPLVERAVPTIRRDEKQGNRFAAAFLAPFHRAEFTLTTSAERISHRFGISLDAASRRLVEFVRLYHRVHRLKRDLPKNVVDFLEERRRKGYKVTSLSSMDFQRKLPTYEGECCPGCFGFKMVRKGTSLKCEACGTQTGDE